MALPPQPMGSIVDSGLMQGGPQEEMLGQEIEVMAPEEFEGGAEVIPDGEGGAIVQAIAEATGMDINDMIEHDSNLAEYLDEEVLTDISMDLRASFEDDLQSRDAWEETYTKGLDLLGVGSTDRSVPFEGASGVTHPLIAESVTQFQAQAYKELLPSGGPVKTKVIGLSNPETEGQATRVKNFMNYLIMEKMEEFDPDMDQMLFYLPLAGSTFKKTYYDEAMGRAVSKFVPAENLVVPYETADLETCPNITQVVRMSLNDLRKRQITGVYLDDVDVIPSQREVTGVEGEIDRIDGIEPGSIDYDCTILECHVDLDLEGYEEVDDDGEPTGIRVPYIVTLSMDNGQVLAVRRNWDEEDTLKKKIQYFTHYKFLPGFGFYGLGLIHTIGGLSRTATSALRQLIDAGTLSNLPAGFKARGLRIRDDDEPLQPGEFRDVDAPGGAIRDSLMPLPFKGPDQTLFQLLGFVVQAGQRFATITDLKVGDGNQQAAVGTTMAMMEQGSRVMSAVHKRLHYAMRKEFRILARVMSESLPQEYPYSVPGGDETIMREDFDGRVDVIPVSNPNVFSQSQRIMLAQTKLQLASQAPEIHNMHEVFSDMYDALGVTDTDRLLKSVPADTDEPIDPAQENINALDMLPLKAFEGQNHQAHITAHLLFGTSPIVGGMPPVAIAVQKHVMEHVQIAAREQAAVAYLQQVQQQGGQPADEEQMLQVEQMTAQFIAEGLQQLKDLSGQLSGAGAPDPLVQLKEQELQQKAAADQADTQIDQAKLELDAQNQQMRGQQFQQRLQSQEEQTAARIQSAMEREILKQRGQAQ